MGADEFGRKASELLGKVKETMIGTHFPEGVEVRPIRIDSTAPWTCVAGEGNISLTKDVVMNFNQFTIAHEMVHAEVGVFQNFVRDVIEK